MFHWDKLHLPQRIEYCDVEFITLKDFKTELRHAFFDEITTNTFSVYEYPHYFESPNDPNRKYITTDESLKETLLKGTDPNRLPPMIVVWNEPDDGKHTSPNKPFSKVDDSNEKMTTKTSTSRDSNTSKMAKRKDGELCLVCGLLGLPNLEACHIWEIKHYDNITDELERETLLSSLGLSDINQVSNLVTMCKNCHDYFDGHKLGIHPEGLHVIVTKSIRQRVANPYSKVLYEELHGKKLIDRPLESFRIQRKVVFYRFDTYFLPDNAADHYCHCCPLIFSNQHDLARHIQSNCKLVKSCQKVVPEKIDQVMIDTECNQLIESFEMLHIDECVSFEVFINSFSINGKVVVNCTIDELKEYLRGIKGAKISARKKRDLLVRIYNIKKTEKNQGHK